MIEDVKLAVECKIQVEHYGRLGGIVPDPSEVWDEMKKRLNIQVADTKTESVSELNTISSEQLEKVISNLNTMVP